MLNQHIKKQTSVYLQPWLIFFLFKCRYAKKEFFDSVLAEALIVCQTHCGALSYRMNSNLCARPLNLQNLLIYSLFKCRLSIHSHRGDSESASFWQPSTDCQLSYLVNKFTKGGYTTWSGTTFTSNYFHSFFPFRLPSD